MIIIERNESFVTRIRICSLAEKTDAVPMIRLDNQIPRKSIRGWMISNIFALAISEESYVNIFI